MDWRGRRQSSNIEDRASGGGGMRLGGGRSVGGTVFTIIVALFLWKACGVNPMVTMGMAGGGTMLGGQAGEAAPAERSGQDLVDKQFISTVLADTEDTWGQLFALSGQRYAPPKLVLFNGRVNSACGMASAATGPFYCPADQKVYLDTAFFKDMRNQLGVAADQSAQSEVATGAAGDFAQAYVIAHEVGHHIQTLLGTSQQVQQAKRGLSTAAANQLSVALELQADCYAGLWAHHTQQRQPFIQQGDIAEALDTATQIGDDRIQARSQGYVVPESFTHGSGTQRVSWFKRGFNSGKVSDCNTFN